MIVETSRVLGESISAQKRAPTLKLHDGSKTSKKLQLTLEEIASYDLMPDQLYVDKTVAEYSRSPRHKNCHLYMPKYRRMLAHKISLDTYEGLAFS